MTIRKLLAHVFAIALGVCITAQSASALALEVQCKPTKISWKQEPFTKVIQFSVVCDEVWYYGRVEDPACPAVSIETAKAWLSMATAAQLSGRQLYFYYEEIPGCNGGAPEINTVELVE